MPYCSKCGAKLDETARFCHVCQTPVVAVSGTARSLDVALTDRELAKRTKHLKPKPRVGGGGSSRISVLFLVSGLISLIFSLYSEFQILALIGLGLTFWGALFLFIRPAKLVPSTLLYSAILSTYTTIDRIINDFKYEGKGYYIPPYPKDIYLPDYLKGLKDLVVFVSAASASEIPSIEVIAEGKFISENPKGVLLVPPGSGILTQIEEKSNIDFTKMNLNELCIFMPRFMLQDLNLAKEMEMEPNENQIYLRIYDSLYKNLYSSQAKLKSVNLIGCPIVSAVACALAKISGRIVTIQMQRVSLDSATIEVWIRIMQGGDR